MHVSADVMARSNDSKRTKANIHWLQKKNNIAKQHFVPKSDTWTISLFVKIYFDFLFT